MAKVLSPSAPPAAPIGRISVEQEMRRSYIDYAMSVIVSRALPDVRDGLKPVHRRILFGAKTGGFASDKKLVKSAKIVGEVMGNYHPHGDAAIYDAMVRMAQSFSMRVPLIHGQGNFGSADGDPPAAMRYTEARMARIADDAMVADLDEGTVDWRPNYDGSTEEPVVLPARFPNILVNGGEGIAVGMATKIAPHNLGEVIDATLAMLAHKDIGLDELMRIIPGPDFPTGGVIQGLGGIRDAFATGRGMMTMASVYTIEQARNGRQAIVITELPYQVNKTEMLEKMAGLVTDKTIEGIADLRDESDENVRVVIELRRDAAPELVLNKLRKHTDFVKRFGVNATCLDSHGNPRMMGLVDILSEFIAFRRRVIRRRTEHRLNKARDALSVQVGLFAARSQVDEVIRRVRASADRDAARLALMQMEFPCEGELAVLLHEVDPDITLPPVFRLSEMQARTILELRLQALTALEQEAIAAKARDLLATIKALDDILQNPGVLDAVMRKEMEEVKAKYATPRLTRIERDEQGDLSDDDLVEDKPVVLTMTHQGYVKITPLDAYREQSRGGKGRTAMDTKDDDFVASTLVCSTKTNLIFFTSRGIAHTIKAYRLPEAAPNAKGRPLINFLQLRQDETVATVMPMPAADEVEGRFLVFVTDHGDVRRNNATEFAAVNRGGKIAMRLEDEHGNQTAQLITVLSCTEGDDIALATRWGKAARFPLTELRVFKGRDSTGVTGIRLATGDAVISACVLRHFEAGAQERDAYFNGGETTWKDDDGETRTLTLTSERMAAFRDAEQTLLTVTANGYGKRFSSHDFRTTARGANGVWVGQFGTATGQLVALFPVETTDGLMLVTNGGQAIRTRCSEIRVMGRATRGVRLFSLPSGQAIVDVARIPADDGE